MPLNDKDYSLLTIVAIVAGIIGAAAITIVLWVWVDFGGYGSLAAPLIGLAILIIYTFLVLKIISKQRARRK